MSVMIDIIGSFIIIGVVMLSIFGLSSNLNQSAYNKSFSVVTQTNEVALARMIEFDFNKIGYQVPVSTPALLKARPDSIIFKAALTYGGSWSTVTYYTGPTSELTRTKNPRDRYLYRIEDGKKIPANLGVTSLSFVYYNRDGFITSALDSIKSIRARFTIESPEPVDTSYSGISWEKRIYPKNLEIR